MDDAAFDANRMTQRNNIFARSRSKKRQSRGVNHANGQLVPSYRSHANMVLFFCIFV
jgi:hypothetical protein